MRDPSPSELLRFVMTTPAVSPPVNDHDAQFHAYTLLELDSKWKGAHPGVAVWGALKGHRPSLDPIEADRLLGEIDVASLRNVIERIPMDPRAPDLLFAPDTPSLLAMLKRCLVRNTNKEVISFLNDLTARIERLETSASTQVLQLGMIFAGLNLSVQAFDQFLARHQQLETHRFLEMGPLIVRSLSEGLSSALFENPSYDTGQLLGVVTGEGDGIVRDRPGLHDKLELAPRAKGLYLSLLARLQSKDVLYKSWAPFLEQLENSDRKGYHGSYDVVQALLDFSQPETACQFLEDIAVRCEHGLPYIETFPGLPALLDSQAICEALPTLIKHDQYKSILDACLNDMEQRLGLKWQYANETDEECHVSIAPDSVWTNFSQQPFFTIDGDCAGYDSPSRLYSELRIRGFSKSRRDLARIVDLLHEHDGNVHEVQPLSPCFRKENSEVKSTRQTFPSIGFRWRPQQSPIEFSDSPLSHLTDLSEPDSPVSLGLLRARKIIHGEPQMDTECLHLMQLGFLDAQFGADQPWVPSGYIVALDRQYGDILAFYVGPNQGAIDPGPTVADPPFGPVFALQSRTADSDHGFPVNRHLRDLRGHYYLDVDPSPDLDPR